MRRASPRPKPRRSGESRLLWAAFALAQVGLAWSPVEAAFARACSVSVNMRRALALALLRQGLTLRKTKEGEPERRRETERESERGGEAEGPRYTASSTLSWTRLEQMARRTSGSANKRNGLIGHRSTEAPTWEPGFSRNIIALKRRCPDLQLVEKALQGVLGVPCTLHAEPLGAPSANLTP